MKARGFNNNSQNEKFRNAAAEEEDDGTYTIQLIRSSGEEPIPCLVTATSRGTEFALQPYPNGTQAKINDATVECTIGGNIAPVTVKQGGTVYSITQEVQETDTITFGGEVTGGTGDWAEFFGALGGAIAEYIATSLEISQLNVSDCGDTLNFKMLGLSAFLTEFPTFVESGEVQIFLELTVVYPNFSIPLPIQSMGATNLEGDPSVVNNPNQTFISNGIDALMTIASF